jgi:glutathione-regulated potassium-efflux system ancillary protein KefF
VRGKTAFWATTTGAPGTDYEAGQIHGHHFEAFVPAISQTAVFCGMRWVGPPFVVQGAHRVSDGELRAAAERYRERLAALIGGTAGRRPAGETHA